MIAIKRISSIVLSLCMIVAFSPFITGDFTVKGAEETGAWSNWSDVKPEAKEGRTIQSKTQYRYRDKITVYSGKDSLSGYTKSGTETLSTSYSDWSPSSEGRCKASDTKGDANRTLVTVETKTAYKSFAWYCKCEKWSWKTKTGKCKYCGKATSNKKFNIYTTKSLSASGYKKDSANDGSYVLPKTISIKDPGKMGTMYCMRYGGADGIIKSFTSKMVTGKIYMWPDDTKPVSRTKTVKSRNIFWKWGNWSGWNDSAVQASSNRQVESKTLYRYCDSANPGPDPSPNPVIKDISDLSVVINSPSSFVYDGQGKSLNISIYDDISATGNETAKDDDYDTDYDIDYDIDYDEDDPIATEPSNNSKKLLVENKDYMVSGNRGVDVGTYQVKITGIGDYKGTIVRSFTITKGNLRFNFKKKNASTKEGDVYTVVGYTYDSGARLSFKSSNTKVATVDSKGKVNAKAPGKTVITGTASKGSNYNSKADSYTLNVSGLPTPAKVKKSSVKIGLNYGKATITWKKASNANRYEVYYKQAKQKKWTSAVTSTNKIILNGFAPDAKYYIKVRGLNVNGKVKKTAAFSKQKGITTKANYNIVYWYDKYVRCGFYSKGKGAAHIIYVPKGGKVKIPNEKWYALKRSDGKYLNRFEKKLMTEAQAKKYDNSGAFTFYYGESIKISKRMLKGHNNAYFELVITSI